ncbi:MAG: alpha/beta fold hydrolase [Candidatus Dormibacteraeota bacterium]|uniref:Alpha/beta fold hydrolase n=1 Tax=Candidatus Aeolococcus gillhamiae TaxID=3127015 RepID=A0A2W6ADL3_9BACT|nr:alpha/beta fold hydrolase [Candidatus Dormibacteraeota bacterium]PZR83378.1 MAG: alpha/beta hydrolase [Candidatus Dormibacter sp. RRmetagenome_bin12]
MRETAAARTEERPVSTASRRHFITLHGQRLAYLEAGQGPPLLLIHGIDEAAWAWEVIIPALARRHRVIAPDLLGHGRSAKPRGDYSLGNQATLMRDLMISLDIEHATLVGHSLGGGITMQFAYQYPERCERMVLVASGGLGQDVTFLLRSLGLPGADVVAPLFLSNITRDMMLGTARWLGRRGLKASPGQKAMWRSYAGLTEPATRDAFIATVRAVIDQRGQRVSVLERLYLARSMPTLLVWGENDRVIPVSHAHSAHEEMPGSRLEIIADAGHFVQLEKPQRVAALILDFLATTKPARITAQDMREVMRTHRPKHH